MKKFGKLLYYYILISFLLLTLYMVIALTISPRTDSQGRGFIPCTEEFIINVSECQKGQITCPIKWLWRDMKCNTGVIMEGLGAWVRGQQKTPWANYIYETDELSEDIRKNKRTDIGDFTEKKLLIEDKLAEKDNEKQIQLNIKNEIAEEELDKSKKHKANTDEVDFFTLDETIDDGKK